MARVNAPLLSFNASGQIGSTQVYGSWKGVPYARRYVIPANPRSTEQQTTRSAFSWLNSVFKVAPSSFVEPWAAGVKGRPLTDRNLFIQQNLPVLRGNADLTGMIFSPGAKGGLIGDVVVTPGDDQLVIVGTPPDPLPSGWSVVRFVAAAIRQQDPQSGALFDVEVGTDATDPYSVTLAGLASAQAYMAGGWFVYQRSSLATDLAYGPATAAEYTTT